MYDTKNSEKLLLIRKKKAIQPGYAPDPLNETGY
jgi:hypothetical protein